MNKVGPEVCVATYTPEDTTHYNVVEIDLTVGVYHTEWTGEGTGTAADPYVITTKAELEHFRDIVNGYYLKQGQSLDSSAYAVLAASIVLGGESEPWTPIGTTSFSGSYYHYRGVFDGAGFTISGLYVSGGSEDDYVGFFGVVSGTVKNLTVSGTVIGKKGVGGIAGRVEGGRAIGCTNEADVTCSEIAWYRYAGGIVGYVQSGTITDCVNKGNVIGYEAGGIAGHIVGGRVENCVNEASASVAASKSGGGIIGEIELAGAYRFYGLSYCINKGAVGNVNGADAHLGGIAGEAECGPISYCYNEGTITNTGTGYWAGSGGMVGRFYGAESCIIENCYNSGVITGGDYVGGMIGMKTGSDFAVVRNSYNIGEITASNDQSTKGEISGTIYSGEITIENCYYLAGESKKGCGNIDDAEGVMAPLTAAEFADASNFSGWSFGNAWAMYTVGEKTRPYLVKTCVKYYDKTETATSYTQPRTLLGIDGTLGAVLLYGNDGFVGDYADLYAKDGYAHDGWATTAGGEKVYDFGDEYAAAEGIVLYPHYTLVTYAITYENRPAVDEGVTNDNPTSYTVEDGDIVLVAPNREGYEFVGWVIGDEDPVEDYTIISGTTGDITLTMEWLMMIDDPSGFAAPTVTALNGYVGAYDGKPHEISVTFEHELDVTYTYRWKKDGAIIEGATSATLSVKDVADTGVYTLLYTASLNGRTREEAEAGPIVVYIGQKSVRLDIEDKTSVEGYVTDATATVKGAVEGERIDVIVTYRKGTTVLTEKPTRPGKYIAVATIDEANYVAEPVEAAFVINVAEIDPNNVENTTGKDITVSSPDGFGEDTTLIIDIPDADEKKEIKSKIGEDKNVVEVYHIDMKEDGKDVELTDPVKVRLPIPDDLKNKGFDVYNVNGDHVEKVKYKIDDDFIEFETDTLGNFAFVERTEVNKDGEAGSNIVTQKISSLIDKIGLDVFIYILIGAVFLDIILLIALAVAILRRL